MHPLLRAGDVVTVTPLRTKRPCPGDTVVFANAHTAPLVAHRVVAIRGDAPLIKGDNCDTADGLIAKSKILGRVTSAERDGRTLRLGLGPERFLIAFLSRTGILSLMLAPARKLYHLFVPSIPAA